MPKIDRTDKKKEEYVSALMQFVLLKQIVLITADI